MHNPAKNFSLALQLAKRDVAARYRGSVLGILWSFLNPLLMLAVYSFVFSFVLKTRWGVENEGHGSFAVILFSGLIIHMLMAEVLMKAPFAILHNPSYVKKVVFPLEILPMVTVLSAFFHFCISFLVLLVGMYFFMPVFSWTMIFLPALLLPYLFMLMGVSWFLAAAGVYLRDISQAMGLVSTIMLFLSPVFYPLSALPKIFEHLFFFNPITYFVQDFRKIILFNEIPNYEGFIISGGVGIVFFILGHMWFMKTRKGFADVI